MKQLELEYVTFPIDETPCCIWEIDTHVKLNQEIFLNSIDVEYFDYIAETHKQNLHSSNKDVKQRASIVLRQAYHQGLETLFMFVGALIQAPHVSYAWVLKARGEQVRSVITKLNNSKPCLYNRIRTVKQGESISWNDVTNTIFEPFEVINKEEISKQFAKLWQKLSYDFLSDEIRNEYNSIKHGFRLKSGGYKLYLAPANEPPSIPFSEKGMELVDASDTGSAFLVPLKIKKQHFYTLRQTLNWDADSIANSLKLIYFSIHNIVSYLKAFNKIKGQHEIIHPKDSNWFNKSVKVSSRYTSMDSKIKTNIENEELFTESQLKDQITNDYHC